MSHQGWTKKCSRIKSNTQECQSRDNNCVYTSRISPPNNFKLDTTTTATSIKGQQLRIHFWDFTTYLITLNWTPRPQECQSRDSNCVYTSRNHIHFWDFTTYIITLNWTPEPQECQLRDSNCVYTSDLHNNFKLDTTTTGMSIKGQQIRIHF